MSGAPRSRSDVVFVNAHIVDPASDFNAMGSVYIRDGTIAGVAATPEPDGFPDGARRIDCDGNLLLPGAVDTQVFVGEPGLGHLESFADVGATALASGVTTIVTGPNTDPVIDNGTLVDYITRRARDTTPLRVHTMATLTRGAKGQKMSEIGLLAEAGAIAFSDGEQALGDAAILHRIMKYSTAFSALIVQPPLDPHLSRGGVMNSGAVATRLGLAGIPAFAETILLARDLRLAAATGARYHSAGIASREAVELIAQAKAEGLPVSCSVSAHHLTLNEEAIGNYRTFLKLSPPLRSEEDRQALVAGVASGVIDCIMSDHCPRDPETKRVPFEEAAFGAIGLETLLAQVLGRDNPWCHDIPLCRAVDALTQRPADIFALPNTGRLAVGVRADLVVFDPHQRWSVDLALWRSRTKNTPFEGHELNGQVCYTMVGGTIVYERI